MFETLAYPDKNSKDLVLDENFNKEYWSKDVKHILRVVSYQEFYIRWALEGLPD